MARLKNRSVQIPNGLRFMQPETGWKAPAWASFEAIVMGVIDHRKGNNYLARKHKWATDYQSVANEVDAYNARICQAHGWTDYILTEAAPFPKSIPPRDRSRPPVAGGGSLKRTVAGVKVIADWLGAGLRPVSRELAERRARVCAVETRTGPDGKPTVGCPQNQAEEGLFSTLTSAAIDSLKVTIEIKNELNLLTPHDGALHACMACGCHNKLKVWTPIEHILKGQTTEVQAALDPKCWVLAEMPK